MGLLLATVLGLTIWIVGWAVGGAKSFDWFLLGLAVVLLAATVRIISPYLPGRSPDE
jgi:hypothetical protein